MLGNRNITRRQVKGKRKKKGQAEQKSKWQLYLAVIRQKTFYLKEHTSLQNPKESSGFPSFTNLL